MKSNRSLVFLLIALTLVASACTTPSVNTAMTKEPAGIMTESPGSTEVMDSSSTPDVMEKPTEEMMETPTQDKMMDVTPTPEAMVEEPMDDSMMEVPDWFEATLRNVNDGSTFAIADFKGKVVLVETIAMWCSSCKAQQEQVKSLLEATGMPADLVVIALDIDPNENEDMLKTYAGNNGFTWIYAIATDEVANEIGNLYGAQFLNPPSTPILIIDRNGEAHPLPFGIKSADDLMKAVEQYLDDM